MKRYKAENLIKQGILGAQKHKTTKSEERHSHDFIELTYIAAGSGTQYAGGNEYAVKKGDIIFVSYGAEHAFCPDGELTYYNLYFFPEALTKSMDGVSALAMLALADFDEMRGGENGGLIRFVGAERQEVESLLSAMVAECALGDAYSEKIVESYFSVLMGKMLRKTQMPQDTALHSDAWSELSAYINENFTEEISLSSLAKKSFYNPSYFSRAFKKRFGVTLSEYVADKRIAYAAELLRKTELSVESVAQRAGFSDKSSLHRAFTKRYQATPSQYRKGKNTHPNR